MLGLNGLAFLESLRGPDSGPKMKDSRRKCTPNCVRRGPLPARPLARPRIVGKSTVSVKIDERLKLSIYLSSLSLDVRCLSFLNPNWTSVAGPSTLARALRSSMSSMPQQQRATRDDYVRILQSEELLSRSVREALANLLLSTSVAAPMAACNVRLVQVGITIPDGESVKSSFPHIVEYNGALSAMDERCTFNQHKTKQTHVAVQLQDDQGAPPPSSRPHTSGLVRARGCLVHSRAPCHSQVSLSREARCRRAAWSFS